MSTCSGRRTSCPFWAATKPSSIAWATRTAASSPTIRAAPLSEWAARIRGSITSGAAEAPSRATRPVDSVAVWLSASMRNSSSSENPLRSSLTAGGSVTAEKTRCSSSRPMLRPFHDRTAWLNPTAGLTRVEGTGPHWLRGTRWTPRTSSAPKAQVSDRSRSRSTTSRGGGDAGGVHAQQPMQRDAELGPALQVHQPGEDRGSSGGGPGARAGAW